ncbi:MAG TPA: RDD family protein [Thermoanaerobaculia bacterium]|nr:RDD family protein [Thermoanaerobaculia bacterium]
MSRRGGGRGLELRTPEGVTLDLELADLGRRAMAFAVDLALIALPLLALFVLTAVAIGGPLGGSGYLEAAYLLAFFLVRTFYFPAFELRWQGTTPGKRRQKVRVVARDGGPLTPAMVFARNLTRELELFLPLTVFAAPDGLVPGAPAWAHLGALLWAAVLLFLPAMNRHRARLGDLVAGTAVVTEPAGELEGDLARPGIQGEAEILFSREQLELYGNRELQVLEEVLRRSPDLESGELLATVAAKVQRKIGWTPAGEAPHPRRFLTVFYAAQRAHLETRLLFGRPRHEKVHGRLTPEEPRPPGVA